MPAFGFYTAVNTSVLIISYHFFPDMPKMNSFFEYLTNISIKTSSVIYTLLSYQSLPESTVIFMEISNCSLTL